jgi:hypothetical protein
MSGLIAIAIVELGSLDEGGSHRDYLQASAGDPPTYSHHLSIRLHLVAQDIQRSHHHHLFIGLLRCGPSTQLLKNVTPLSDLLLEESRLVGVE